MQKLTEQSHFLQYSASCYCTPSHQISGQWLKSLKSVNIVAQMWFKPIMENFKVPQNVQKLAKQDHFK